MVTAFRASAHAWLTRRRAVAVAVTPRAWRDRLDYGWWAAWEPPPDPTGARGVED